MTVTTVVELPEVLAQEFSKYVESHEKWSDERAWQAAVSLFLLQNGSNNPEVNSLYLESLFGTKA